MSKQFSSKYFKNNYAQAGGYESLEEEVMERTCFVIDFFLKNLDKKSKILCVGSAFGFEVNGLKQRGFDSVWGVDISKDAIREAKDRYPSLRNKFLVGNAEKLNIKKKFDLILAFDVIEHLSSPLDALISWKSHLKNDGKILIITPNPCGMNFLFKFLKLFPKSIQNILDNDLTHKSILPDYKWKQFFKKSGLKIEKPKRFLSLTKNKRILNFLPIKVIQVYLISKD